MANPQSGESEQLQSVIRKYLNEEIREWFKDVTPSDIDNKTPRGSLLKACKHVDEDSFLQTIARTMLFDSLVRGRFTQFFTAGGNSDGDIGTTRLKTSVLRSSKPQISLHFLEDFKDIEDGYAPVDGRISFRLMDKTAETITPTHVNSYEQKIETAFKTGGGFVWKKGKFMCSYTDWEKGYQLQLLCKTVAEGKRVVEQVLDIQNDTPDWSQFNFEENDEPTNAFPTIPEKIRIYGLNRRIPRRRPVADVRYQYSKLNIQGVPKAIVLADRTGLFS